MGQFWVIWDVLEKQKGHESGSEDEEAPKKKAGKKGLCRVC